MLSLVIVLVVRVLYVMYQCGKPFPKGASRSLTTLIVLGSGKKHSLLICHILLDVLID